jgi:predicted PurR-regulated permease PerM
MSNTTPSQKSPIWTSNTKMVVGLTIVAIIAALFIRFNVLISPLILAFMLSYLLIPVVKFFVRVSKFSWRVVVSLIYLLLIIAIIILVTITGVAIVQQLENLINVATNFVADLPDLAEGLSAQDYTLGPFVFNLYQLANQLNIDLMALSEQILSIAQPLLGQAGGLIGTMATSAASLVGWTAFVLVISFFILTESGDVKDPPINLEHSGHSEDLRRILRELGRIWNIFFRGQLIIFLMVIFTYFILMTVLGVRNALVLSLLTGLAKFVPYVGPLIAGLATALVAIFQGGNYLGIDPIPYALIVIVGAIILDQSFDNLIAPRMFGKSLGVHPAAVLVSAFILATLIGFLGLLLAAPVLASVQMIGQYTLRKMVDQDPWPDPETETTIKIPFEKQFQRAIEWIRNLRQRGKSNDKQ